MFIQLVTTGAPNASLIRRHYGKEKVYLFEKERGREREEIRGRVCVIWTCFTLLSSLLRESSYFFIFT